jgi:hypothetical protein
MKQLYDCIPNNMNARWPEGIVLFFQLNFNLPGTETSYKESAIVCPISYENQTTKNATQEEGDSKV